jgi:hypothetical protein
MPRFGIDGEICFKIVKTAPYRYPTIAGVWLTALLLLACTSNHKTLPAKNTPKMESNLIFSGDTVTISGVSAMRIGHGEFRIENPGAKVIEVKILKAELVIGDKRTEMGPLQFMPESAEESSPATSFQVRKKSTLNFIVGFPPVEVNAYFSEPHSVALTIEAGDQTMAASSPIVLSRRIPGR